jgi:octaprenyl-diphosphate synthase
LFVLSSLLCGYKGEGLYRLSTIFEYIHTASLLHDDVLDNAEMRRKKPSVNHAWGNSAAILGGDYLYSKSFSMALACKDWRFLELLTDTTTRMAEGQMLELSHTHNWHIKRKEYMEIITSKTALLISAACACGAIVSGAEHWAVDHLGRFGLNMGIAFQLVDDLLDYTSSEGQFGKPVGKDLREGKITLPLIYTLAGFREADVRELERLFKNQRATEADYRMLMDLIRNNGVIDRVRSEAESYAEEAGGVLRRFPESSAKNNLKDLNQYLIRRNF